MPQGREIFPQLTVLENLQIGLLANPARPMVMEHLRVIAFVQDDATQDILQAIMVDVSGK